jgi:hypothetical protein
LVNHMKLNLNNMNHEMVGVRVCPKSTLQHGLVKSWVSLGVIIFSTKVVSFL